MPDDLSISEYLEEILESGRAPEEVCINKPELLDEIRRRLRKFRAVQVQIDDLFPSSTDASLKIERNRLRDGRAEMPPIPGYDMQCVLGYGGMGVVYKARHIKLKRFVAVKMLLSGVYASPIERTRFLREAEAVARLSHPNVVQVHDTGEYNGRPYFTMELVEGGTLARQLDGTPWPAKKAAMLILTLAQAVETAHRAGIVHRDLKPGNILLDTDGLPKISDFGLARRDDDDLSVTLTGTRVGTPCYMAPEQSLGQTKLIGPPTDVYSLGAILYELLTGRPPFRGESTAETEQQLLLLEPVPPRRLNAKVPRDLETICLKCLSKQPDRRYGAGAELARDLGRFLRDEPILARRTGPIERSRKWVHRHPAITVAAVACLLLATVLVSESIRSALTQARVAQAIGGDLQAVSMLQRQDRFTEAREALEEAETIVGGASLALQRRCARAASDLDLAITLDRIRLSRSTGGNLMVYRDSANQQYDQAFAGAGLGRYGDSPTEVAKRVDASAVRAQLVAALDDWVFCATGPSRRDWVLAVARLADPDPLGWNARILDPKEWNDPHALVDLANSVPMEKVSAPLLLALAECLTTHAMPSASYLIRVQRQYPDDFWMNLVLGNALLVPSPGEAREFYRAALGLRPDAPVGYCAVGDTLRIERRFNEALIYYQKSIQLDPSYARGYANIGLNYQAQGEFKRAIEYYNKSLKLDPQYAWSYFNLGVTFEAEGQTAPAMDAYRKAIALEPNNPTLVNAVRSLHMEQEPRDHAWVAWHDKIAADPPSFDDWWGYAELTVFLGKDDEYRSTRQALLKRFGSSTDPLITEKIGRACLLLPGTNEETREAQALIDRSVNAGDSVAAWLRPYFVFAKGFAEYRQGHWDQAIAIMRRSAPDGLGPCPQLILAMALEREGKHDAALETLAMAVASFDWRPNRATKRDLWFTHILRREAEAMILPKSSAFLQGKYQPGTNNERLALLGIVEFNSLHATEAQLLADAFTADPTLADDVRNGLRFRAACAAAAASEGRGPDARKLSDTKRAALRDEAIAWLQKDLLATNKSLDREPVAISQFVLTTLGRWPTNHDLASIHDTPAIERLPAAERDECNALWRDLAATLDRARGQAAPGDAE